MDYYVLQVKSNKEESVCQFIRRNFSKYITNCFSPSRIMLERKRGIVKKVERKLFLGYVFIEASMDYKLYYKLKRIPDYNKILSHHDENFSKVPLSEISNIKSMLDKDYTIQISFAKLSEAGLIFTSGPLKGREDKIKKLNIRRNRARVGFNINGKEKHIDLSFIVR
ncbi:antiterminator LoaP [Halalkalibacter sp. APA_J-10(15)]|uniref:antiterminator LoaP n=1 Tax=Halalkalibacter sp. APA_J-10(15) TaxID=2933805 RepID=UPI001FF6D9DD|nr:antiterminator LoaP [Halalkalibacter sp. APA_J-10(15)]MCK0471879.1 antiterminator LoaP [Halalkalibacter sp. APA_J-10(15)]